LALIVYSLYVSPGELGNRVIDVEIKKDSDWYRIEPRRTEILSAEMVSDDSNTKTSTVAVNTPISYFLEYQVDSSRGFKHFFVRSTVRNRNLYVFTVQCEQDSYPQLKPTALRLLRSFKILEDAALPSS